MRKYKTKSYQQIWWNLTFSCVFTSAGRETKSQIRTGYRLIFHPHSSHFSYRSQGQFGVVRKVPGRFRFFRFRACCSGLAAKASPHVCHPLTVAQIICFYFLLLSNPTLHGRWDAFLLLPLPCNPNFRPSLPFLHEATEQSMRDTPSRPRWRQFVSCWFIFPDVFFVLLLPLLLPSFSLLHPLSHPLIDSDWSLWSDCAVWLVPNVQFIDPVRDGGWGGWKPMMMMTMRMIGHRLAIHWWSTRRLFKHTHTQMGENGRREARGQVWKIKGWYLCVCMYVFFVWSSQLFECVRDSHVRRLISEVCRTYDAESVRRQKIVMRWGGFLLTPSHHNLPSSFVGSIDELSASKWLRQLYETIIKITFETNFAENTLVKRGSFILIQKWYKNIPIRGAVFGAAHRWR